jgi:metallo-beta-lactamase family protein
MFEVESFGGADTVTGSCHRVTYKKSKGNGAQFLIDAGLFQGAETKVHKNTKKLPFSASDLKGIFLTHAHLDHCGLIPLLCLKGFNGPIFVTEATKDLAAIILKDAAKIQQANARSHNKDIVKTSQHIEPLYRTQDVERALGLMKVIRPGETLNFEGLVFDFFSAGHIPGAVSVSITIKESNKKVLFSGDLGRVDDLIMNPPVIEKGHDVVFIESTYGGHNMASHGEINKVLSDLIKKTKERGSVLLIPAFTVARTQMVVSLLYKLMKQDSSLTLPIIMDSPMGLQVNKVFERYLEHLKLDHKEWQKMFEKVYEVEEKWQEEKVRTMPEGHILISSSGMMTGGKVLGHFARLAFDKDNIIFLPGHQGRGTLGRKLVDGERSFETETDGKAEVLHVKCEVHQSRELSAHADQNQLTQWLKDATGDFEKCFVFLIHGEKEERKAFRDHLKAKGFSNVELMEFQSATTIL